MKKIIKFYIRLPFLGAIYFEAGCPLYKKHLYSLNRWNKEIIIEFPLGELILTPRKSIDFRSPVIIPASDDRQSNGPAPTDLP